MKLFIMFEMVSLLAALCLAQPVDKSAPEQPDTSGALRFKRNVILPDHCPPGYIMVFNKCTSKMDAEYTDPISAPDQSDIFGIKTGDCPPSNTNIGDICLPDDDYYYTEK